MLVDILICNRAPGIDNLLVTPPDENDLLTQGFLEEAIRIAREGMRAGKGGPFGAVVVLDGRVVGRGCNEVLLTNDPTAHAEITAIRDASRALGSFHLAGCRLYTSCEPCPMCLGAVYWARIGEVFHACTRADAARIGFIDAFIYEDMARPARARSLSMTHAPAEDALRLLDEWMSLGPGRLY